LTPEATNVLQQAVEKFRQGGNPSIVVEGHADRSGTDQYNEGLSKRRAEAVRNYLQRQGIASGNISVEAFGESRPLVNTADGVREPQNRRVEIRTK
ncbi:MAG TPA: OmpA family protein, partial [Pedomonas sp.]|uniref:OmpA family protein n=1 Tax=Pedomonas sp. TaxID=2976421 RepID=UPI002F404695